MCCNSSQENNNDNLEELHTKRTRNDSKHLSKDPKCLSGELIDDRKSKVRGGVFEEFTTSQRCVKMKQNGFDPKSTLSYFILAV
jgi:hypothetical protein